MFSFRFFATATVVLLAIAPAFAEAAPSRVRGTITAINDGSITVKEKDGRTFTLKTGQYTTPTSFHPASTRSRSTTSSAPLSKGRRTQWSRWSSP
jgi:hypothetical protein